MGIASANPSADRRIVDGRGGPSGSEQRLAEHRCIRIILEMDRKPEAWEDGGWRGQRSLNLEDTVGITDVRPSRRAGRQE